MACTAREGEDEEGDAGACRPSKGEAKDAGDLLAEVERLAALVRRAREREHPCAVR